ncbi:MAG TPA: DNA-3-methyladenine glycosylase 2 family protein [Candidatus Dormibacteraeota bacterium]|nr:DNA-3-methyladenine glycosylase 2 family protein [Candidatus Dormibacteraeota bacterium]
MKTSSSTFEIVPQGEYSLEQGANFIGAWHRAPSASGDPEGHLHLAFLTDDELAPVGVCLKQDSGGRVLGTVHGGAVETAVVVKQVERILSLDVDGRGWPDVGKRDPIVARLQRMFPGFRPVNWSNAYEAAAWCVISSRISMRQAQVVKDRMSRELGQEIDVHGHALWTFPGPDRLAHLEKFPGLFGRKVEYLNALGRAALAGEVDTETLRAMPPEEALKSLQKLPGIGAWGSQLVRLRALSAVDELPSEEPRLMGAIRTEYGLATEPDQATLERLAEKWSPYRMWVCVCLRRTLEGGAGMTHSRASEGEINNLG